LAERVGLRFGRVGNDPMRGRRPPRHPLVTLSC
jgi:hypothetical protein